MDAGAFWIAASFATSLISNRNKAKTERVGIELEVEQARTQASDAALQRAKQYRQNISANLALAGMGKGGVSGFRGVSAQSASDFIADSRAIENSARFAEISGQSSRALSKSNRFAADVGAVTSAADLAAQLGLFKPKVNRGK